MRKTLSMLLALALLLGALAIPALADDTLISRDGVELHTTGYRLFDMSSTHLVIYVYAANDNDYGIRFSADNATVDGTPVKALGFGIEAWSEYGDNTQSFMFLPTDENPEGGAAALRNARRIEMDIKVLQDGTYKTLFTQHVSFNVPGSDSQPSGSSNDYSYDYGNDYGGSSANTAPVYTPASYDFKTLQKGSKGQAVRDLQQRLTDLGYLNDRVDGSFGRNTTTAVRSFCSQNGLPINGAATPEMQELLYSSRAQYYEEPWLPLMIAGSFKIETPKQTGVDNTGMIIVEVVNRSSTRGIRGYSLSYYKTDMYNNKIDLEPNGRGQYHQETEEMRYIEPGHYTDAYYWPISLYYSTYAVYVGVQKVVLDDGEVREIDPDDVQYFECVIAN